MHVRALIQQLRQPGARNGVGVWLLPRECLGQEEMLAARLNLHPLDARQAYLDRLPAGARFSGLTRRDGHQKLLDLMRALARETYPRACLLVHTLDLLLLALEVDERERFWCSTLEGIPYPRSKLLLTLPEQAYSLFAPELAQRYAALVAQGTL
ncbi:MAG: hypothetical protein RMJ60_05560 [Anaerolineales bacterium]|nr:hypothetical protein [Anaerolineales bacterium]